MNDTIGTLIIACRKLVSKSATNSRLRLRSLLEHALQEPRVPEAYGAAAGSERMRQGFSAGRVLTVGLLLDSTLQIRLGFLRFQPVRD